MGYRVTGWAIIVSSLLAGCQALPQQTTQTTAAPTAPTLAKATYSLISGVDANIEKDALPVSDTNRPKQSHTPPEDLWELTRQHFQLQDAAEHKAVATQIKWYSKFPSHMRRVSENAARYYYYVLHEVLKRDLPAELALVPVVESMYNPQAYSSGHAAGIWQFIPSTAKYLGLKKTDWYDGRRDVIDSTQTALDYLEALNRRFDGDWLLTLAAYNAGGGTISKAQRKNREAGKPTNYWSLKLPKETRLYVPRILAIARFIDNPERYNMALPTISNTPYFGVIKTPQQMSLAQIARLTGAHKDELRQLNPGMRKQATPLNGPHRVVLPRHLAPKLATALQAPDLKIQPVVQLASYKVQSGDTLSTLAERFNTQVSSIRVNNGLKSNRIRIGQTLQLPAAAQDTTDALATAGKQNSNIAQYRVQSGDSLWLIARQHNLSTAQLASWNNLNTKAVLSIGQPLRLAPLPESVAKEEAKALQQIGYRVKSGDSLHTIANRYDVKVADIRQWNNLSGSESLIKPGQQLKIFID